MDALWSLEDKWKLSTQKAIALFACTSVLVIGLCVAVALKRRRKGSVHQEPCKETAAQTEPVVYPGWRSVIMKVLMGSARWSRGSKWEESLRGSWRETPRPLLVKRDVGGADGGRQSHNSTSAVWQRPILMGEKCELPRFSGLIMFLFGGNDLGEATSSDENYTQGLAVITFFPPEFAYFFLFALRSSEFCPKVM